MLLEIKLLFASKPVEGRNITLSSSLYSTSRFTHTLYKSLQSISSSFRKRSWKYNLLCATSVMLFILKEGLGGLVLSKFIYCKKKIQFDRD